MAQKTDSEAGAQKAKKEAHAELSDPAEKLGTGYINTPSDDKRQVAGYFSQFTQEVRKGCFIVANGEQHQVGEDASSETSLLTATPWRFISQLCRFYIISDPDVALGEKGEGRISFKAGQDKVIGSGTRFKEDCKRGDVIISGSERRMVSTVVSDIELRTQCWLASADPEEEYSIYRGRSLPSESEGSGTLRTLSTILTRGDGTLFTYEVNPNDIIILRNGEQRVVDSVMADACLCVNKAWPANDNNLRYAIRRSSSVTGAGKGKITFYQGSGSIIGDQDADFLAEVSEKDTLLVGNKRYVVKKVFDSKLLQTTELCRESGESKSYMIIKP